MQGTLALEDALSTGSPIRTEVDQLRKSLEGIDKDSLLELALSSIPEDVLEYGSDTPMDLKQKVSSLCCNKLLQLIALLLSVPHRSTLLTHHCVRILMMPPPSCLFCS